VCNGRSEHLGSTCELRVLEYAHRAVSDDDACVGDDLRQMCGTLQTDVQEQASCSMPVGARGIGFSLNSTAKRKRPTISARRFPPANDQHD